jgi:hypothetical protein
VHELRQVYSRRPKKRRIGDDECMSDGSGIDDCRPTRSKALLLAQRRQQRNKKNGNGGSKLLKYPRFFPTKRAAPDSEPEEHMGGDAPMSKHYHYESDDEEMP